MVDNGLTENKASWFNFTGTFHLSSAAKSTFIIWLVEELSVVREISEDLLIEKFSKVLLDEETSEVWIFEETS